MIAIVALTKTGLELGKEISQLYSDSHLYVPRRHEGTYEDCYYIQGEFSSFIALIWNQYSQFIFIMATGIVVRSIAPLLKNKMVDPAVLVVDEGGHYVIALLSGHFGGANALAQELAGKIKGVPIVTTASDVQGIPALDDLARRNNFVLENCGDLQKVALSLLEEKPLALYSSVRLEVDFPTHVRRIEERELSRILAGDPGGSDNKQVWAGVILITERTDFSMEKMVFPHVIIRPRNLIVGVGCRQGKKVEEIVAAIRDTLRDSSSSLHSLSHLATVEIKKDEPGLLQAAAELGIPLRWVKTEEIKVVEEKFSTSAFVKAALGIGAVSEPAAYLTASIPRIVRRKQAYQGITTALVRDDGLIIQ